MSKTKRKSLFDIEKQVKSLISRAECTSNRRTYILEVKSRYTQNISRSRVTHNYDEDLHEAIQRDIDEGRFESVRTYRGSTPAGGPDPDEWEDISTVDHSRLETKWKRYHHLQRVYQYGQKE